MAKERVIIKVGTSVVLDEQQPDAPLNVDVITRLLGVVQELHAKDIEVALVISGAVGAGRLDARVQSRQAQAARGQWLLNKLISITMGKEVDAALVLLSREDIVNRQRFLTLQETFNELFEAGIVPLVNENDATTLRDKNDFPDNDHLAAILGASISADKLFLLTDVEGVFTGNPKEKGTALIRSIENVNLELLKVASGDGSGFGRGGMVGKLTAARLATAAGVETSILFGREPERVLTALDGYIQGTRFAPRTHKDVQLSNRDRWNIASLSADGSIQVDEGAAQAVRERKSLLAVGMKEIFGEFDANDVVEIMDHNRETVAVGRVCCDSGSLSDALGDKDKSFNMQVVHADDIILI